MDKRLEKSILFFPIKKARNKLEFNHSKKKNYRFHKSKSLSEKITPSYLKKDFLTKLAVVGKLIQIVVKTFMFWSCYAPCTRSCQLGRVMSRDSMIKQHLQALKGSKSAFLRVTISSLCIGYMRNI